MVERWQAVHPDEALRPSGALNVHVRGTFDR
jgi:hypothetical protein